MLELHRVTCISKQRLTHDTKVTLT